MKLSSASIASLALFLSLGYLPSFGQTKAATCDPRLGLANTKPVGYTKGRWQDAEYAEGDANPAAAREVHNVLKFGTNAIPPLIGCLCDEMRTKYHIWDYWPEPKVRDLAFSILCDLISDRMGQQTLDGVITWSDVQAESPDQPAWIAWGIYNDKHGQQHVQQVWLKAWAENKTRICWGNSAKCFKVKETP
jgi:hypothetical protein